MHIINYSSQPAVKHSTFNMPGIRMDLNTTVVDSRPFNPSVEGRQMMTMGRVCLGQDLKSPYDREGLLLVKTELHYNHMYADNTCMYVCSVIQYTVDLYNI